MLTQYKSFVSSHLNKSTPPLYVDIECLTSSISNIRNITSVCSKLSGFAYTLKKLRIVRHKKQQLWLTKASSNQCLGMA